MATSDVFTGATKDDMVKDRDVVNDGGLVDDAGGMIEEKVAAKMGGGVDVNHEDVGDMGLEGDNSSSNKSL